METKHGLSQGRLNRAKEYSRNLAERIAKIEMMFQLSVSNIIDGKKAEDFIELNIKEIDQDWEYFKSYIKQRDDMRKLD
ncbi:MULTISPECIES: hypothetical protein [Bacillus]|uniref:hypothetical protein n=1 Tax=Bacillus TaxID=1386 RepID=UPI0003874199|nr:MULTISPECIES: hypothetical protein [Bacillus]MBU8885971.1 hypothetical protein [Bacillus sp. FJAT-27001]CDG30038.1 conserved protein of unknown function [Bacillus velezensis UCMB5033]